MARAKMAWRLLLFFPLFSSAVARQEGSPIQKVIELLEENKEKLQNDLAAEEKEFEEYANFCDDEVKAKDHAVKSAGRRIEQLNAALEDNSARIVVANDEVSTLGTSVANTEGEVVTATGERRAEKNDFTASEKELVEAVDQLDRAIMLIKREMSFIQKDSSEPRQRLGLRVAMKILSKIVDASWVDRGSKNALKGFLQQHAEAADDLTLRMHQPAPKVEEKVASSTQGILTQLEDMKEKAEETLSGARTTEMSAQHNFDMMGQSLGNSLDINKDKISVAKGTTATLTEESGKASGQLVEINAAKAADEEYTRTLKSECQSSAVAWETRSRSANEEMAVIAKAKHILTDRVKVFVQFATARFTDTPDESRESVEVNEQRSRLAGHLKVLARKFNSYAMMEMATAAAVDPFIKIRGIIEEMITKLKNEAAEELTQKGFCDEEKAKSVVSRDDKQMKVDKFQSRMDKGTSEMSRLQDGVKEAEAEIAEIDASQAEATKIRNEESETSSKASSDYKQSAEAVNAAKTMLKEYYAGSFLQTHVTRMFAKDAISGDAAAVIIHILEESERGFTEMYMQLESTEQEAAAAFGKLTTENKVSRATAVAESKGMGSRFKSLMVAVKNYRTDIGMTNKELDSVIEYLDKLKPQCESKVMSYGEKKQRREDEIQGLKEALGILDGPSSQALLQVRGSQRLSLRH